MPREIDALIARTLADISPIRSIAQVVQTGTAGYRKLVTTGGTPSGWVSETAARPETDTPSFAEIAPPSGDLLAGRLLGALPPVDGGAPTPSPLVHLTPAGVGDDPRMP